MRNTHGFPPPPLTLSGTAGIFGVKNRLLVYRMDARYRRRASGVRDAFSKAFGAKNRLLVYGGDIRYSKRPSLVPNEATRCGH